MILGAQSVWASEPDEGNGSLERTIAFLQQAQNADGGFSEASSEPGSPDFSAWAALALAAAGINPQDQTSQGGADVFSYLSEHADELVAHPEQKCVPGGCTSSLERELLVVDSAGTSPTDFGGVNLVQEILARQTPAGSFVHVEGGKPGVNDTVFAILALSPIHEPAVMAAIAEAANWLVAEQDDDGSWPGTCRRANAEDEGKST